MRCALETKLSRKREVYIIVWLYYLKSGVELVVTGDLSLVFTEGDPGCFNICVLVADLPAEGISCDQVILLMTQDGTAG